MSMATWDDAGPALDGLPEGRGLNIAHEAVDRHAAGARADRVAVRWLRQDGTVDDLTFRQLRSATNQFANALRELGITKGERVASLLGRGSEVVVAALGAMKVGAVFCPLFTSFGPDAVRERLDRAGARVLVTTPALADRTVASVRTSLPGLEQVVLVADGWLDGCSDDFEIPATDPEDPALLQFTSGTSGPPKGALHVHDAIRLIRSTARTALDLRDGDVYWCTADPGWVTGTVYGIIAPLTLGVTSIIDEAAIDARRWYRNLADQRVTVWYTSPTALRMLLRAGPEIPRSHDLSCLRHVASVGEPLAPEVVRWGEEVLGVSVHDTWWQTETGAILIANPPDERVRPGSMGRPLPGVDVAVLVRGDDGRAAIGVDGTVRRVDGPEVDGELAVRAGWPSMFRGYLHDDERYRQSFVDGWYLTGDVVRCDAGGWLWFSGRADDAIESAGHLIGPWEVERVLVAHPSVLEAAAIGVPDPMAGEVVKGVVVLRSGADPSGELASELLALARRRLGPAIAPRSIAFVGELPHTTSGKILRRALRAGAISAQRGGDEAFEAADVEGDLEARVVMLDRQ